MSRTYLTKKDVELAYNVASIQSYKSMVVDILFEQLEERLLFNKEQEREADVKKWIAQEKRERTADRNKAKKHNAKLEKRKAEGEYVDVNEYMFNSPGPNAMTYRGVTICGKCLRRKEEGLPKEGCYSHYWEEKKRVQRRNQNGRQKSR